MIEKSSSVGLGSDRPQSLQHRESQRSAYVRQIEHGLVYLPGRHPHFVAGELVKRVEGRKSSYFLLCKEKGSYSWVEVPASQGEWRVTCQQLRKQDQAARRAQFRQRVGGDSKQAPETPEQFRRWYSTRYHQMQAARASEYRKTHPSSNSSAPQSREQFQRWYDERCQQEQRERSREYRERVPSSATAPPVTPQEFRAWYRKRYLEQQRARARAYRERFPRESAGDKCDVSAFRVWQRDRYLARHNEQARAYRESVQKKE